MFSAQGLPIMTKHKQRPGRKRQKCQKRPKRRIALLDLPQDLWTYIIDLAITEVEPVCVFHRLCEVRNAKEVAQPGIINSCRKLRNEYLRRFYENTMFYTYDYISLRHQIVKWLMAIGPSNRQYVNICVRSLWNETFKPLLEAALNDENAKGAEVQVVRRQRVVLFEEQVENLVIFHTLEPEEERARQEALIGAAAWADRDEKRRKRLLKRSTRPVVASFPWWNLR